MINVTKPDLPPLDEYVELLRRVWSSRWLTNDGELVRLLKAAIEDYLGVRNLVLMCNGTLALQIALKALDSKGEVITTPFTFAATTNAVMWEGSTPIFADIDPETFNIDPGHVERRITRRTIAILATHVYGNPCDVKSLAEIASKHGLTLLYDAAHAFAVQYENQSVMNYGDMSTLSFHATKVFNSIEGGGIVVRDEHLSEKLRLLRDHGVKSEEQIVLVGTNAKMNEFQAAMGLCNLRNLDARIRSRKAICDMYRKGLDHADVTFQRLVASKYNYIYMPACFRSREQRDEVYSELLKNQVKARKYFFPLTTDFDYFRQEGQAPSQQWDLAHARDIANRILCLPLYSDLDLSVVQDIIRIVQGVIAR